MRIPLIALALTLSLAAPSAFAGPEQNKAVAARVLLEKMGEGKFEISDQIYGPGFVAHGFGRDYSLAEDNESGKSLRTAIPDMKVWVDRMTAEGEMVAVHWGASGTNSVKLGFFPGTGKPIKVEGMTFFRFADGRIVEEWTTYDNLGLMQQLGLLPAAPAK